MEIIWETENEAGPGCTLKKSGRREVKGRGSVRNERGETEGMEGMEAKRSGEVGQREKSRVPNSPTGQVLEAGPD